MASVLHSSSAIDGYDVPMDENDNGYMWGMISPLELSNILNTACEKILLIDSRSFLEYNTSTIQQSVNVSCSKLVKRRLQQDEVHIQELLCQTCHVDVDTTWDVIVYDQCTEDPGVFTYDNFVHVLLRKLATTFNSVNFLSGGFLVFQAMYPGLVDCKANNIYRCTTLTSLSQPCLPVSNVGPTRILPFLYLGSSQDALSLETAQINGINYVLNLSTNCPRSAFVQEGHFHRIPIGDNYSEKILPYLPEAFQFLDKVREANGCVLVHCLAGISRSPTLAIAYIMKHMRMSSDDAYRYVKDKRPTISPNFNFLGQLLEYEHIVRQEEERQRLHQGVGAISPVTSCSHPSSVVMDLQVCSPPSPGPRTTPRASFDFDQQTCPPPTSTKLRYMSEPLSVTCTDAPAVITNQMPSSQNGRFVPESEAPLPSTREETPLYTASDSPFPGPSEDQPSTCGNANVCSLPGPSVQEESTYGSTGLYPHPGPSVQQESTHGSIGLCPLPGPSVQQDSTCGSTGVSPLPSSSVKQPSTCGSTGISPLPGPSVQQPSTCGSTGVSPLPGPSIQQPSTCGTSGLCPLPGPSVKQPSICGTSGLCPLPGPSVKQPSICGTSGLCPLPGPSVKQPSICGTSGLCPLPGPSVQQPSTCESCSPFSDSYSSQTVMPKSLQQLHHIPMPSSPFPGPSDSNSGSIPCTGPRYCSIKSFRDSDGLSLIKRTGMCDMAAARSVVSDTSVENSEVTKSLSLGSAMTVKSVSTNSTHNSSFSAKVKAVSVTDSSSAETVPKTAASVSTSLLMGHGNNVKCVSPHLASNLSPSRPGSLAGFKQRDRPFTLDLSPVSDSDASGSEPATPDRSAVIPPSSLHLNKQSTKSPVICKLRLITPPLHMLPSPTSAMAHLNMSSVSPGSETAPSPFSAPAHPASSQSDELPFQGFPTTSLDKLNFTPCYVPELTRSCSQTKSGAVKRPISATMSEATAAEPSSPMSLSSLSSPTGSLLSVGSPTNCMPAKISLRSHEGGVWKGETSSESGSGASGDLVSPMSISSQSSNSSSGGSNVASPTAVSATSTYSLGSTKVVLRSKDKSKLNTVRPNSIAFSTYPIFDLASESRTSMLDSRHTSHDDSSEACLNHNSKKLRPNSESSEPTSERKFRWGRYSEREVYRQISAAMEKAMLGTQVYEASRKARSLDDILSGSTEESNVSSSCQCSSFGQVSQRCGIPVGLDHFSPHQCQCGSKSEPYQSNSSISSGGSHNSLHGSMEIIQVS